MGVLKVIRVLLEKRPRLRKENFEALVNRDLRLIGFDLAEVGIGSGVDGKLVFEHELCIEPDLTECCALRVENIAGIARVNFSERAPNGIGDELNVPAR